MMHDNAFSRRKTLSTLAAAATSAVGLGACRASATADLSASTSTAGSASEAAGTAASPIVTPPSAGRMPAVFLPHGGGPWPFIDDRVFGQPGIWNEMRTYMEQLSMVPPRQPSAIVLISAHWEAEVPTIQSAARPPMYYDYGGFQQEAYEVQWPAPGAPDLASEIREILETSGIVSDVDSERGFDHGVFVPLKLAYPEANIPTLQVSLKVGLDPAEHFRIGQALGQLRDKEVFLVGSGMSYHNMRELRAGMRGQSLVIADDSRAFDEWLEASMLSEPSVRHQRLVEWANAPAAIASHPREEHLIPLMVIAGACAEDIATLPYRDVVMGAHISAVHFG